MAASVGPTWIAELPAGQTNNILTKERLAVLLCVLMVVGGVMFGLMYW
jgi:hypothetical protein